MLADILEAQASVDWPVTQFPSLQARLDSWLKDKVYIDIEELPPPAEADPIVAIEKELLPLAFNVEVGAYINAIRSSLDILAVALVRRHNLHVKVERIQFPVAPDRDSFIKGNYQGSEFVNALPAIDRRFIHELQPYSGGNEWLWTLHRLDIMRKHRRLLNVEVRPLRLSMAGADLANFIPINSESGWLPVNEKTVLGLLSKGTPRPDFQFLPCVAFNETDLGLVHRKPVIAALNGFVTLATLIIQFFGANGIGV